MSWHRARRCDAIEQNEQRFPVHMRLRHSGASKPDYLNNEQTLTLGHAYARPTKDNNTTSSIKY